MISPSPALVAVNICDKRWLAKVEDAEARATIAVCAAYGSGADEALRRHRGVEVSVLLAGDADLQRLNNQYCDKDHPTNVLSFSAMTADDLPALLGIPLLLGDIAVSYDTALGEADDENKTLEDHLCHLVVHGMLHLLGFEHESEEQAAKMEWLEIVVLAELGVADPYKNAPNE